jgi:hypothetical protein
MEWMSFPKSGCHLPINCVKLGTEIADRFRLPGY